MRHRTSIVGRATIVLTAAMLSTTLFAATASAQGNSPTVTLPSITVAPTITLAPSFTASPNTPIIANFAVFAPVNVVAYNRNTTVTIVNYAQICQQASNSCTTSSK